METFRLSEAEYLEASRLFSRPTLKRILLIVILVPAMVLALGLPLGLGWGAVVAGSIGGVVGGLIGSEVVRAMVLPWKVRKLYRQHKGVHEPMSFAWDELGTSYSSPFGMSRTPWEHYRGAKEGKGGLHPVANGQPVSHSP